MESVIEFPKLKMPEEADESTELVSSKKIFNMAVLRGLTARNAGTAS
jgi:hypothetical protein